MPGRRLLVLLASLTLAACEKAPETSTSTASASAKASAAPAPVPPITRLPAPARIVAMGDLHGDLEATKAALQVGGLLDDKGHWSGGAATLVQTGDQLDRGDGERAILDLLDRLADEAKAAGGSVVVLDGNHEVMNVQQDFRYATEGGFKDFAGEPGVSASDPRVAKLPEVQRARGAAFLPGGPEARRLARRGIVAVIGDTVFVHGGVLPKHVRYGLDRMNREVSAWMEGNAPAPPAIVTSEDGPIWTRLYSAAPGEDECRVLREALDLAGAARMVVGHTVQRGGVSSACGDRVWRIDVGLSRFYGGKPEVLEIAGDKVRAIRAK